MFRDFVRVKELTMAQSLQLIFKRHSLLLWGFLLRHLHMWLIQSTPSCYKAGNFLWSHFTGEEASETLAQHRTSRWQSWVPSQAFRLQRPGFSATLTVLKTILQFHMGLSFHVRKWSLMSLLSLVNWKPFSLPVLLPFSNWLGAHLISQYSDQRFMNLWSPLRLSSIKLPFPSKWFNKKNFF